YTTLFRSKKEIAEGRFREDLYHRLAVILIQVPALNDRREDIPLLIEHFSEKIASEQGSAKKKFSDKAVALLKEYDWTGNIRELRNVRSEEHTSELQSRE